jgi:membrane peptidoglycan carboxypeptidase
MNDHKVYNEATKVTAKDGDVILDGPDGVDVRLTPEAAEKTSDEILKGALKATGQRRMKGNPHRAL